MLEIAQETNPFKCMFKKNDKRQKNSDKEKFIS
ncbi:hypothetical protein FBBNIHIM_04000 [Pseudocitrobacter vendiensis]|uniref:Uncharacterized protein n=1 Tax=Pseudocitrobacter vendiensis TaxID=2488306 RepID=A0ABM9F5G6_9ENTR|nr:hypothetical protein FBBNIHIM_04000 [Pseudocitrobacter vendiensis]